MENKRKVKFNGMDLFIVILAIIVVAAGVYLLSGRNSGAAAPENVKVRATVEVTGKNEGYEDAIKVGDVVMIGEKDKLTAVIESVEVSPAKMTGYNILDGKVLRSEIPEQNDIKVTFTATGTESVNSITIDGIALRVGQNTVAFGKGWSSEGYIIGLETEAE